MSQNIINGLELSNFEEIRHKAELRRKEILSTGNTEDYYEIKGMKYYISFNGSDSNSGLSPDDAFATTDALKNIKLNHGDAVLFNRNGVYRVLEPIAVRSGITYGSYGEGAKPALYGSPANYAEKVWFPTEKLNVWKTEFPFEPAAGMVFDFGKEVGRRKDEGPPTLTTDAKWCDTNAGVGTFYHDGVAEISQNGDFTHDYKNGVIYLYCDKGNPSKVYESIEILKATDVFRAAAYDIGDIVIDNLTIKYVGGFPISLFDRSYSVSVTNCVIGYSGGLYTANCGVRFGNGIEFWSGGKDIKVENNWIYQVHDTAVSWQGRDEDYENVSFSNNLLEYNNCDFEFFGRDGDSVENFRMDNNIMRFTCGGWGTRVDDSGIRGIEGCIRARTGKMKLKDISFKRNIIDSPARQIFNWSLDPEQKPEIHTGDNTLYFDPDKRTTKEVVLGLQDVPEENRGVNADNINDLKAALARFDKNIKINWKS